MEIYASIIILFAIMIRAFSIFFMARVICDSNFLIQFLKNKQMLE